MTASTNGSAEPLQSFHPGLTIGQAASMLKMSPSTVRRWVRSGRLQSERVVVGDGHEYRIPVDALEGVKDSMNPSANGSVNPSMNGSMNASELPSLESSMERSSAMAAYNRQLLEPLTSVIEHQQETIRNQAEQIGRLSAELEAARATPHQSSSWWAFWRH